MTRTASLAGGIVLMLLSLVWFVGRFELLPAAWSSDLLGLVGWAVSWLLLLGGAALVARALWPRPLEHEPDPRDRTTDVPWDDKGADVP